MSGRRRRIVPGKPLFFATAMPLGGFAQGVLVESHMGRPTKIEGNPQHPASLGATDAFAQASVLTLYDPDRSQVVINAGRDQHLGGLFRGDQHHAWRHNDYARAGLRVLTETVTSPTLAQQLQALLARVPRSEMASVRASEPAMPCRPGARLAFGEMYRDAVSL